MLEGTGVCRPTQSVQSVIMQLRLQVPQYHYQSLRRGQVGGLVTARPVMPACTPQTQKNTVSLALVIMTEWIRTLVSSATHLSTTSSPSSPAGTSPSSSPLPACMHTSGAQGQQPNIILSRSTGAELQYRNRQHYNHIIKQTGNHVLPPVCTDLVFVLAWPCVLIQGI